MPLTAFGKAIRRARLDTGHTQTSMAFELGTSASYLSALENGAKTISDRWLNKIVDFFTKHGLQTHDLGKLAAISNQLISLDGLPPLHQMLIAELAFRHFSHNELSELTQLVKRIGTRSLPSVELLAPAHMSPLGYLAKGLTPMRVENCHVTLDHAPATARPNNATSATSNTWLTQHTVPSSHHR
ncbi:helix-turn-helix domain-containing protein (plasmid) [Burkholderia pyrrocinia]|uniref:helix-turn-helix domain-containing protein n=1 Tax=Burkholderia pyrrocinia TaxID=60550 RepID=UPI0038B53AFE